MKILVHHDGTLGDLLLSVPCLLRIRSDGPVHLVGRGDVIRLLKKTGAADQASASEQAFFSSLYTSPDSRVREFLSGFDSAFVFTADESLSPLDAIRSLIPATSAIRTFPGSSTHAAEYRLSQLAAGISAVPDIVLNIPGPDREKAGELLDAAGYRAGMQLISLHPGSGGKAKCWPLERYFDAVERLQERTRSFTVLFTGEAEKGELHEAVSAFVGRGKNRMHAADLDLLQAAAILRHCGLYIGNDSGFSHVAGLVGCPSIVIFGPTDPAVWRPLGSRVQVVSSPLCGPITGINVEEVVSHAERMLSLNRPGIR